METGVELAELHWKSGQLHVRQHWMPDLGGEQGEGALDALPGQDVVGRPAGGRGQPVEQMRVDVVPDAKREHSRPAARALGRGRDPLGVLLACRGQPVGQEEHDREPPFARLEAERLRQRPRDVGGAVRVQALDPVGRLVQRRALGRLPVLALHAHRVAERDQAEAVLRLERRKQRVQRRPRLPDLLAGHRARNVHHDRHVARLGHRLGPSGREGEHQVAVLSRGPVRRHRQPHRRARGG